MLKNNKKWVYMILAIFLVIFAIINCTFAWQNLNQKSFSQIMGKGKPQVNIEFILKEKNIDLIETENPIYGTTFYLFNSEGKQIGEKYITDENGKINIILAEGEYYFEEITPQIGYTFDELNGEKIIRYDFNVEGEKDDTINIEAYNIRLSGQLLVRKNIENKDDSALTDEQKKQEFTFTINFSDNGIYKYNIDNGDVKEIKSGETFVLKHGQTAKFDKIPVGTLYNIKETPIEGYIINSEGHRGNITDECKNAIFTNTYEKNEEGQSGSITITQEVIGENANLDKEFTYNIIIDKKEENFSLKNGQSKTFSNIKMGAKYTVTQTGEAEEKYISTISEYKGEINEYGNVLLPFINVYNEKSEEEKGKIVITKEVVGEKIDENKEFEFKIEFNGENAPENSTFKLKADESKTFENVSYGTNYVIKETNTNGYSPTIESVSGSVAGKQSIDIKFKNIVPEENKENVKISIKNTLEGEYLETDKQKEFEFILLNNGKETKFTLKADQTKEFELPIGAYYEINEKNYYKDGYIQEITNGSGIAKEDIIVNVTNTYVGEPKIIIAGEKKWQISEKSKVNIPEKITVKLKNGDLVVEKKIIQADAKNNWNYSFIAQKYDKSGKEIKYTIEEETVENFRPIYDNYNITNVYVEPIKVNVPSVEKIVQGENTSNTKFEFTLKTEENAPMPDGAEKNKKMISLNGAGTTDFGTITFTNPGVYTYTITEVNSGIKGWTYDDTIYNVIITITEKNYKLSSKVVIKKDKEINKNIVFTNAYKKEIVEKNAIVSGEIIWEHGSNPEKSQPKSIIIKIYGDGILKIQKQITKLDNWKYYFELPKFATDGHEITYTVDEEEITGYSKKIEGYNLINKYIITEEAVDNNNSDTQIDSKSNPKTGDNIIFWVIILAISSTMIIILQIAKRKKH